MTRALAELICCIRWRLPWKRWPRVKYCPYCTLWAWCTNETPAYSAHDGAFICEVCADINDKETDYAWRDYYANVL